MEDALKNVISSTLFNTSELPQPSANEKNPPGEETDDTGLINVHDLGVHS
jgi:hypothetical protein